MIKFNQKAWLKPYIDMSTKYQQARNERGERGGFPCLFLKFREKCPDLGKKLP